MNSHAEPERRTLDPGTILADRFEVCEFLGAGSFGEVYRAKQLLFGRSFREVALKLFAEGIVTSENAGEVLNDALVVLGLLDENPSIDVAAHLVQVYDMGIIETPSPRAFMSMRLVSGKKTLRSEIYRFRHAGGMPVSLSLRYIRELLLPLAWMHSLDFPAVHGDLKPENVMLTEDLHLVLVDYGLAARMPIGVRGGTISYDASEKLLQISDMPGGPAADVYSVGLIWYELLTGTHPFATVGLEAQANGDLEGYVQAHISARKWPLCARERLPLDRQRTRIVPASEVNLDLAEQHPQVELILNKCLAENLSERFPNARVLLDCISDYVVRGGTLSPSDFELIGTHQEQEVEKMSLSEAPMKTCEGKLADAAALIVQGKPEQAMAIAEGVLQETPDSVQALLIKAKALVSIPGRVEDADTICGQAMTIAPSDPEVFRALATVRSAQGKRNQAAGFRARADELERARRNSTGRLH